MNFMPSHSSLFSEYIGCGDRKNNGVGRTVPIGAPLGPPLASGMGKQKGGLEPFPS